MHATHPTRFSDIPELSMADDSDDITNHEFWFPNINLMEHMYGRVPFFIYNIKSSIEWIQYHLRMQFVITFINFECH